MEREQAAAALAEAEDAWSLEKSRYESRITTIRTELTTVTERVTIIQQEKTFLETRVRWGPPDYATHVIKTHCNESLAFRCHLTRQGIVPCPNPWPWLAPPFPLECNSVL